MVHFTSEGLRRCSVVDALSLMRPALNAAVEASVESGQHLVQLHSLEPGATAFDLEALVEQGAVKACDNAV